LLAKLSPDGHLEANTISFFNKARIVLAVAGALLMVAGWFVFKEAGRDRTDDAGHQGRLKMFLDLFIISFLVLFFELVYIRWLPSYVRTLSYFTNFVLIGSFVGMSIGCLISRRRVKLIDFVPASIFITVVLVAFFYILYAFEYLFVSPGEISGNQRIYFGFGALRRGARVPLIIIIPLAYAIVVFPFVGLGQVMGRALNYFKPVQSYSINVLGSIAGIVAFAAISWFCLSPHYWFLIGFAGLAWFVVRDSWRLRVSAAILFTGAILVVVFLSSSLFDFETFWSPYYRITFHNQRLINTNEISHQEINKVGEEAYEYSLPYIISDYAKRGKKIESALIIGAGSGNDTAYAVMAGVGSIDAVDIDPTIMKLGRQYHPDKPYSSPNVRPTVDDGRSFLRKTNKKYDMIVYAVVDSLTLMSTYSSVRLENYLFTQEAFNEVRDHLTEDGIFVIYNFFRRGWLGVKISDMLERSFGKKPLVFSRKDTKAIREDDSGISFVMFIAGDTEKIAEAFKGYEGKAVVFSDPFVIDKSKKSEVFCVELASSGKLEKATDDWPFLYMKKRSIPIHNIIGIAVIVVLSAVFFRGFAPGRFGRLNWHFFFLGAAFMLLETRSIAKLSLLFGSTWMVNSFVFFSILVTILIANLFVIRRPKVSWKVCYMGLFAALALNYFIPLDLFLGLGVFGKFVLSNVLLFLPILFAALVFAGSFRLSTQPDYDFGSNIAGVVVGGVCEYLSLVMGFHNLLLVAAFMYLLSLLAFRRKGAPEISALPVK